MTRLDRLLRLLGPGSARPNDSAAAERIEGARAAVQKWKARADEQTTRAEEIDARLADSQQALARRRRAPTASTARCPRWRLYAARSKQREERLPQASPAYRAALDAGPDPLRTIAEQKAVHGLTWWVPLGGGAQRLPFRGILPVAELGDALAYVEPRGKTDVLLFAADGVPG